MYQSCLTFLAFTVFFSGPQTSTYSRYSLPAKVTLALAPQLQAVIGDRWTAPLVISGYVLFGGRFQSRGEP